MISRSWGYGDRTMPGFRWLPVFETGCSAIDDGHRAMVTIIEDLHAVFQEEEGFEEPRMERCRRLLDALADVTRDHFSKEESVLADSGFPRLGNHQRQHDSAMRKIAEIRQQQNRSLNREEIVRCVDDLTNLMITEIVVLGMDFKSHLQEVGHGNARGLDFFPQSCVARPLPADNDSDAGQIRTTAS